MGRPATQQRTRRIAIAKQLGVVIGILGGLFALAKQGYDLWYEAHKAANIALITGNDPLDVSYDPVAKTIQFSFNIGVINSGTASDAIRGGQVTLERLGSPPKQLLSSGRVKFYDTDKTATPLRLPYILGTDYQKTLYCIVSSEPGWASPERLDGSDDLSRLRLNIEGANTTAHTADLCFYLTQAAVAQLLETQHASFVIPNHCGEAQ
jgi:hypothetical protein